MTRTAIGQEGAGSSEQVEQEVQGRAQQVAGRTKGTLRDQLDRRSTQAGEQLHGQVTDVRAIARELREQGKERPARLAEQGAQYVERLGGYLRDADADRLLADVEGFARSKAWAVVAGAGALGAFSALRGVCLCGLVDQVLFSGQGRGMSRWARMIRWVGVSRSRTGPVAG